MYSHRKKITPICCEFGCVKPRVVYGRCHQHFVALDPQLYHRLQHMTRAERKAEFEKTAKQPAAPRWEYINEKGEAALIAMVEKQESES